MHLPSSPRRLSHSLALSLCALAVACGALGEPEPEVQRETPAVLPRPDFHFQGEVGKTYQESDPPQFPQPTKAPEGVPNVVLILLDDTGFGPYSTFGGGVPSPTLDALASEGLRINRVHTTALCNPTRAALITGRNHHNAATGVITEAATGYDGYTCVLPRSTGTVGEVLRRNGYMTAWIGKNHNTPAWETSAAGPFDRWVNGLGFDDFYGFNGGHRDHRDPLLFENRNLVPRSSDPDYHLTEDLADHAIDWVRRVKSIAPDKPFLLYVAPGANHAPHHASAEWIDRFKGQFDMGWDAYRAQTLERQKKLGVVPPDTELTARSEGLPAWDSLEDGQKRVYARMMEVYAGFAAQVDHEMGRIVDAVRALPDGDNTIFVYIAGDNGASAEGGLEGSLNENLFFNGFPESWEQNLAHIDEIGGPKWFNHFPSAWAHAMNAPFQWTKQVASHFGGTRNPLVVSWPGHITDRGGLRTQFLHTIDIVPTLYEAIGITPPVELNGVRQKPMDGVSFLSTFGDADAPEVRETQYFELLVNRGLYHDGWMASSRSFVPWAPTRGDFDPIHARWELYDVANDFSQARDVAAQHPEKVAELEALFWREAERNQVLPLDWRAVERLNAELQGRPSLAGNRSSYVYYPGQVALPDGAAPPVLNKSFSVTVELEIPEGGAEGMLFTHGGLTGGYGLYLRDGKAHFVYNMLAVERYDIASEAALPSGKLTLVADVAYQGAAGELGKPAKITLSANGTQVGAGELPRTVPLQFSLGEGCDVGMDLGSAVDFTYELPFAFTGTIEKVTVDLK